MKRIVSFLIFFVMCFGINAQIPHTSMDIIKRHYPRHHIVHYEYVNKHYIVNLSDNTILKFKRNGDLV